MVIVTTNYADFKTVVTKLLAALESPTVFGNASGAFWFAWAVVPSKEAVVTISLSTGEPNTFATDYPTHTDLIDTIQVE